MELTIKTQIIEVYRTAAGLRATVSKSPKTGVWMMRIYNPDGTVKHGGNYVTRKGAMIALSLKGGKNWAWVGIESEVVE